MVKKIRVYQERWVSTMFGMTISQSVENNDIEAQKKEKFTNWGRAIKMFTTNLIYRKNIMIYTCRSNFIPSY